MGKIIHTDGSEEEIDISDQRTRLKQLQDAVGGYIELVGLSEEYVMFVNEEGLLKRLPENWRASEIIREYVEDLNWVGKIVGDVVLCTREEIKEDNE